MTDVSILKVCALQTQLQKMQTIMDIMQREYNWD